MSATEGSGTGSELGNTVNSYGTIDSSDINETHKQIKKLVGDFDKIHLKVNVLASKIEENWVGLAETAYETEAKVLIGKIEDIGDMLKELYDHLVESEAEYLQVDDDIRKEYVKVVTKAREALANTSNTEESK